MSDMNNSADYGRSLSDSDAFVSELRDVNDKQTPEKRTAFWSRVFSKIGRDADTMTKYRQAAKSVRTKGRGKFILILLLVNAVAFGVLYLVFFRTEIRYHKAEELMAAGEYAEAQEIFGDLAENREYKDSRARVAECQKYLDDGRYQKALKAYNAGDYESALTDFECVPYYQDSADYIRLCKKNIIAGYGPAYNWDFAESLAETGGLRTETVGDVKLVPVSGLLAGQAVSFGRECVEAPAKLDLGSDWCISAMLRSEDIHAAESCIAAFSVRGAGYAQTMRILLENGRLTCRINDGRGNEINAAAMQSLEMHKWYLVSVMRREGYLELYVDGSKVMQNLDGGNYAPPENAGEEQPEYMLRIGAESVTDEQTTAPFNGEISWLSVYQKSLTEDQLRRIQNICGEPPKNGEQTADIPADAIAWNGHHYAVFRNCVTVPEAIAYCQLRGGYLASVNAEDENMLLRSATAYPVVIGLTTDSAGASWNWVNGESVSFNGIAEDCDLPAEGERYYARFSRSQENPGWYLYHDTSMQTDEAGNTPEQDAFVFLCEWDS